jgi:DNA-binding response OmpR family regulator
MITVLILEDDEEQLQKYKDLAMSQNYLVYGTGYLEEGLKFISEVHTNGVICDMTLYDGTGLQFVGRARAEHQYHRPILLHSGMQDHNIDLLEQLIIAMDVGNDIDVCKKQEDMDYMLRWLERLA